MSLTRLALACLLCASLSAGFQISLGLPQRNLPQLEATFWAVSTPGTPEYLQFRSRQHIAGLIGASDSTVANASAWLIAHGGQSLALSPLRDELSASFEHSTKSVGWIPANDHPTIRFDYVLRRDQRSAAPAQAAQKQPRIDSINSNSAYSVSNQKKAYGIPADLTATNPGTVQMVWGPGSFGYSTTQLSSFKASEVPLLNMDKVNFDTQNHGHTGDNYMEGNLDTQMISAFGLNVSTLVSNTNTSASTEEGQGFGQAMLSFLTELAGREALPQVMSLSLGSLSAHSCNMLCDKAAEQGVSMADCTNYLQQQRQVCMFMSEAQTARINTALQVLGTRGVTVFGSSGDGGSHFSFQKFQGGSIASVLNTIACKYQMPVAPSSSPYITSVGGTEGSGLFSPDLSKPKAWSGSGGGFSWRFAAGQHQQAAVQSYLSTASGLPDAGSYNATGRGYPDLSALAVEGTSQSSPIVAGIFSLLTDHRLNAGLPGLGFLGPRLYQAMAAHPGKGFKDVTSGNTKTSCDNGFRSQAGWDPVTGWGQPVWPELLELFGSD